LAFLMGNEVHGISYIYLYHVYTTVTKIVKDNTTQPLRPYNMLRLQVYIMSMG